MKSILEAHIEKFSDGRDLGGIDAEPFLDALIEETNEPVMTELFRTWDKKGIGEDEIYSIARIMRDRCTRVETKHDTFIDIVGTGGSRSKTFNVSTAAAFVVAGGRMPVAKHGNRAATSNSGSADVLTALGIEPAVDATTAERCLNEIGVCFMFAPNFHRLSPTLAKVRRGLGFPTIFNCVGPLCSPAGAPHQLIGVWSATMVPKIASALARLGTKRSWIVHGRDGLDEISLAGPTLVAEVENDSVRTFEIEPKDFGLELQKLDDVRVGSAEESARLIRDVLEGRHAGTVGENLVIVNAMAAFHIAGPSKHIDGRLDQAVESIRNGHALTKLNQLAARCAT